VGESAIRGNTSHVNGVYNQLTPANRNGSGWRIRERYRGFTIEESRDCLRRSARPCLGPNEQRGVFRSKDGGKRGTRSLSSDKAERVTSYGPNQSRPLPAFGKCTESHGRLRRRSIGGILSQLMAVTLDRYHPQPRFTGTVGISGITVSLRIRIVCMIAEAEDGGVFRSRTQVARGRK
jgi:hypothetical protein